MKDHGGTWVGWVGSADEHIEPFTFDGYGIMPVDLSAQEFNEYYEACRTPPSGRSTTLRRAP